MQADRPAQTNEALSHVDEAGNARMVDVGDKAVTNRLARAGARVSMRPETAGLIVSGGVPKGDVIGTARLAGVMAAKRTSELIPLCHPLALTFVNVEIEVDAGTGEVAIEAEARTSGQTGVEMEALTACSVAALTIYDMVKAVDRETTVERIELLEKSGGKSGHWRREET